MGKPESRTTNISTKIAMAMAMAMAEGSGRMAGGGRGQSHHKQQALYTIGRDCTTIALPVGWVLSAECTTSYHKLEHSHCGNNIRFTECHER